MQTAPLGTTGLTVTRLGFGSQTIGGLGYGRQEWALSAPTIDAYLSGGGRFIDTSRGYGVSEIYVGKALLVHPASAEVVVCSKSGNLHPPCLEADLEVSRHLLNRETLDVYYLHVPPHDAAKLDQVLGAYEGFKEDGRIRHIGLSSWPLDREDRDERCAEVRGWIRSGRAQVIQFPYSFASPWVGDLISEAAAAGIGCVVRNALHAGLLSGAYRPGHRFTDTANDGRAAIPAEQMDEALHLIERIREHFCDEQYRTVGDLALSYVLSHPGVSATIPGGGTPAEVVANLHADSLPPLPEATRRELEVMAAPLPELLRQRKAG